MTRKILIGIGALIGLILAALLVAPFFIDLNKFKPEIVAAAEKATGRPLAIDGEISASLLPLPTVSVEGIRLGNAEGGQAADFASLGRVEVRVALLPLLGGEVQVKSVTLVRPVIAIEKLADGSLNLPVPPASAAAPEAETTSAGGGLKLSFDSIVIEDGTISYTDLATGAAQILEALNAEIAVGSLQGPFEASGSASYQGIAARFAAMAGGLPGDQPLPVRLELGLGDPEAVVSFDGTLQNGKDGPAVVGKLAGQGENLASLLGALSGGPGPALAQQSFAINGDVAATQQQASVENLTIALGDQQARGAIAASLGDPLTVEIKLGLNRLDLDKLLGAAGGSEEASGEAEAAPEAAPTATGGAPAAFALPGGIVAKLDFGIKAVTYRGATINQLRLLAGLADGVLTVERASALLPGSGDFTLAGQLAPAEGIPNFTGGIELHADDLRGLLSAFQVALPDVPSDRLRKLSLTARLSATPAQLQIGEIDLRLDTSQIAGGVVVALPGPNRPSVGLGIGLAIDQLNIDAYLPPADAAAETATASSEGAAGGGGLPLDALKPLAALNANVELKIGELTLNDQTARGLHLDATVENATLTLRDLSVKDFAGGSGKLSGLVGDLAGSPHFDTAFDLNVENAAKALQFAGLLPNPPEKLGQLTLGGSVSGGANSVTYDVAFAITGIGAAGAAEGTVSGIGAGLPAIDSRFDIRAERAGPLLEIAGLAGASEAKLGALALVGTAKSGEDRLDYDVTISLTGVGGQGAFKGAVTDLKSTPSVDTALDFRVEQPAPLLALFGIAGADVEKYGALGAKGTLNGNADDMTLDLALLGIGGQASLKGNVKAAASPMSFDLVLSASHPELSQLAAAISPEAQIGNGALGPVSLSAKASGSTEVASVEDIALKLGASDLAGRVDYRAPAGGKPDVTAAFTGSLLDLSPFLPPGGEGESAGGNGQRWSEEPLDLSALDAMNADITAKLGRFVMNETVVEDLDAHLILKDGSLTIERLNGRTFGGSVDLTGRLIGRGEPNFAGKLVAEGLSSSALMGGGFLADRIEGPISLTTDLTASGVSQAAMVRNLNGTGNLAGKLTILSQIEQTVGSVGLNLLGSVAQQYLGDAGGAVAGLTQMADAAYSAFTGVPNDLTGDFQIVNGEMRTDNLTLANPNARALTQGVANLPSWTMDMVATIFRAPDLSQPFFELGMNGLLDSPDMKFKALAAPGSATGGEGLIEQVLPGAIEGVVPGLEGATGGQPEDLLQGVVPGLLGGGEQPAAPATPDGELLAPGGGGLAVPEAPADVLPEVAPEAAIPEALPEVAPEAVPEIAPEAAIPEVQPEPVPEAQPEELLPAPGGEGLAVPEPVPEAQPEPVPEPFVAPEPAPLEPTPEPFVAPEPAPLEPAPEPGAVAPGAAGAEPGAEGATAPAPAADPLGNLLQEVLPQPSQ